MFDNLSILESKTKIKNLKHRSFLKRYKNNKTT